MNVSGVGAITMTVTGHYSIPFCALTKHFAHKPRLSPHQKATFVETGESPYGWRMRCDTLWVVLSKQILGDIFDTRFMSLWLKFCWKKEVLIVILMMKPVTNLHMSRQLSCRDMCRIVTWSILYVSSKRNMKFLDHELIKPCEMVPSRHCNNEIWIRNLVLCKNALYNNWKPV